jgi:hypothetical protein
MASKGYKVLYVRSSPKSGKSRFCSSMIGLAQPRLTLLTHCSRRIPAYFTSKNRCGVSMRSIIPHYYIANFFKNWEPPRWPKTSDQRSWSPGLSSSPNEDAICSNILHNGQQRFCSSSIVASKSAIHFP